MGGGGGGELTEKDPTFMPNTVFLSRLFLKLLRFEALFSKMFLYNIYNETYIFNELSATLFIQNNPGLPPYKKQGNHRKSYMVIYENSKVIESTTEVYGYMQVIKRPYCSMIPCKSYTAP